MSVISLLVLFSIILPSFAVYTWPSSQIDQLEDILYVQSGFRRSGFFDAVTPCSFGFFQEGRITAAEWVRTAFHDMSTHDAVAGTGGLDASLMWETERPENPGKAFNGTFGFILGFYSVRSSMADLIALATYTAVRSCRGPAIPFRVGRVDATGPGPEGVPQPDQDLATLSGKFAAVGFNTSDMIKMVACGHSLGGVHGLDFPNITGDNSNTSLVHFDSTFDVFDPAVVTEYLHDNSTNPLVVGPSATNSDLRVFAADGNATMRALADPTTFKDSCKDILQRMIDTVPSTVALTDPIAPIPVKPVDIQLTLNANGSITFTGTIRVLVTGRSDSDLKVVLDYADHDGNIPSDPTISTTVPTWQDGLGFGFDYTFKFFTFSNILPSSGISHFNVTITSSQGTEIYNNNGGGFPVQDSIIFQGTQSCLIQEADAQGKWNLTVVAAVRNAVTSTPSFFEIVEKTPRQGVVAPALAVKSISMRPWAQGQDYDLYSASYYIDPEQWVTTFDVVGGSGSSRLADEFKGTATLSGSCVGSFTYFIVCSR